MPASDDRLVLAAERGIIVPPADYDTEESFRGLVLRLRGRIALSQRELAAQLGVHAHSIQAWEAGVSYPGVVSLQALIAAGLRAGGFTAGREAGEASELWAAAMREAPRLRTPFDRVWFDGLSAGARPLVQDRGPRATVVTAAPRVTVGRPRRESWGDAPDTAVFVGRVAEQEVLLRWAADRRCRVIFLHGLGGIGKTLLASRLARDLAPTFECVIWRSLLNAPTPSDWLTDALGVLAPGDAPGSGDRAQVTQLIDLLGEVRCLLVLDNFETVLEPGDHLGDYREGYGLYGTLLRQFAERPHRGCLVLTSREEPPELGPLRGEQSPVRVLELDGFGIEEGRTLLGEKRLGGDEAAWRALVARYGGNGLALKVVGETIRELFGGDIAAYLEFAGTTPGVMTSGVRQLLETQIGRLSSLEKRLLRWLAVEREPIDLAKLADNLAPLASRLALLEAVEGLRRRSLLERIEGRRTFTLQAVVLEYVTEQLIEDVDAELTLARPTHLLTLPLMKATAADYVRRSQERLVAMPLLQRLRATCGTSLAVERRLLTLLSQWRGRPVEEQGYGPGNVVNLLRLLRGNLRGIDLSSLTIRQAFLQEIEAQDASLAGSQLAESALAEAFRYPPSVSLSADGTLLAAGTSTGEVCIWRVADRTLLANLRDHTGGVWGVALSGDGRLVVSGSVDATVKVWEVASGRLLTTFRGHTGGVRGVAISADGRLVASGAIDGVVTLWEAASGRSLATLGGHTGGVQSVTLSGDGRLVASGGIDGTVRLWAVEDGRPLATLEGHTVGVHGVTLSGDGRLLASGGMDGTVSVWQVERGQLLSTLQGHSGGAWSMALSADGRRLASGAIDGTIRLWAVEDGRPLATLQGHAGGVRGVALNADGRLLTSGSDDGTVRLWDAEDGRLLATLHGDTGGVWGVALNADGKLAASACLDGTIRLWDAEDGQPRSTLHGHTGGVRGVALSEEGQLLASASLDGTVRLWGTQDGRLLATLRGHTGGVSGVAISADGRLVASGSIDATLKLWDARTGGLLATLHGHAGGVWGVALSADGRLVASSGIDGTVRLWDAVAGRPLATLSGHIGGVWGVALSADGRLVASGGLDGMVRLWDTESEQLLATLRGHVGGVWDVAISADGQLVASGGLDGTVRLWDTVAERPLATLPGHVGGVWDVALSADGRLVASGSIDGTVKLWATSTGECFRILRADRRYERLDITGLIGITDAQREALLSLGAVDRSNAD
jgi:WD40 repeat protein/transcriptional regulator with XRE-family HTH domain